MAASYFKSALVLATLNRRRLASHRRFRLEMASASLHSMFRSAHLAFCAASGILLLAPAHAGPMFPWGRYPSEVQASNGCELWAKKGGTYLLEKVKRTDLPTEEFPSFRDWRRSNLALADEADSRPLYIDGKPSMDAYDEYVSRRKKWYSSNQYQSKPRFKEELITATRTRRWCEHESSTSQYIGYEVGARRGQKVKSTTSKIMKHFRY